MTEINAMTGREQGASRDHQRPGDHPQAKGVWDVDSIQTQAVFDVPCFKES